MEFRTEENSKILKDAYPFPNAGKVLFSFLLWLFIGMTLCPAPSAFAALRVGNTIPAATMRELKGASISLPGDLRGKVVVLHFWAIGCSSCREEMPLLDSLYDTYRKKGLEVLAVNVGQSREQVTEFAKSLKVSYPILLDQDNLAAKRFEVVGVPRTFIIDRNGIIRFKIVGSASSGILKKYVLSLL